MTNAEKRLHEIMDINKRLMDNAPEESKAFFQFMDKAKSGPILTDREKELINVALSISTQCEWCITLHVKYALEAGATKDEIIKAGFQAVLMSGGPGLMHMVPVYNALDEFGKD